MDQMMLFCQLQISEFKRDWVCFEMNLDKNITVHALHNIEVFTETWIAGVKPSFKFIFVYYTILKKLLISFMSYILRCGPNRRWNEAPYM